MMIGGKLMLILLGLALTAVPANGQLAAAGARAGIASQASAWNAGDLEQAMATYWHDARITWVHHGGVTHGFAPFAESLREQFGARPDGMGHYSFEVLDARDLGPETSLVVLRWSIRSNGARAMGGISTQLWELRDGLWQITLEHADDEAENSR